MLGNDRTLTVHSFAGVESCCQTPADVASNISALRYIACLAESKALEEFVKHARGVVPRPVLILGLTIREGKARERGHDDMIR